MKTKRRAIDNGYNHHKVAWVEDGKIKTIKYPAILGSSTEAMTELGGGYANMYESTSGERFVVDEHVSNRISLRTGDYGLTEGNRVLVNHGLRETGIKPDDEVMLVTSLPVRDFFSSDGSRNEDLIAGQKESMMKPVKVVLNNTDDPVRVANIVRSDVVSEAVAAAFDFLVDNVGESAKPLHAPLAVLDFGGSTFDVVTLTKDLRIRHASSGTLKRGTMDIIEPLKRLLLKHAQEMKIKVSEIPDWMINQVMATGKMPYFSYEDGKPKNTEMPVNDVIEAAAAETVSEIKAFVKQKIANFSEYQAVLLVGGGSLLCRKLFRDWEELPQFIVMDEFANARGMLKLVSI
ncbi:MULTISPECIES: ParM/StbA family protein [Marinobacter]|uniref:StbA family protein n=1 Tax=Marinobacter nauticus (strain ATCC 700491 / DSM 11845 / VT8) TaxID=351348 RepID=A1U810_MARN8|nr:MULTISPECIES: ParM/StbA family protein [Marinobacter]ABM21129.1 StbA family protein [Marinobacter nauticus VT8]